MLKSFILMKNFIIRKFRLIENVIFVDYNKMISDN